MPRKWTRKSNERTNDPRIPKGKDEQTQTSFSLAQRYYDDYWKLIVRHAQVSPIRIIHLIRMEMISRLLLIVALNVLCTMTGYAAPLLQITDAKDAWSRNVFAPVIKAACSSDGQCWGWLPKAETYDGTVVVPEQETDTSRLQSRRQIANPESKIRSWKDSVSEETGREIQAPLPINKQIPTRITKKDIFVSRGWGAGGMPFSVLYMNPRSNHAVTATSTSQRQEVGRTTESSTPFVEHSNFRIHPRNSQSTVQPRRQYWTIPQLFISYGWNPFPK